MITRTPKAHPATLPSSGARRSHAAEPIPTLEEARTRLAALYPETQLQPKVQFRIEEISSGIEGRADAENTP